MRAIPTAGSTGIADALRGQRIFVTGATGFVGKTLVEKLLWAVPEVGRLLLLVRPDGERGAGERLSDEVLASPAMARLRHRHGGDWPAWAASKVEAVAGDLGSDRFGLDAGAYARLAARVDRVVACAATVRFDERLERAVELNARGALRALRLARDAGDAPLVHLSTCFVSGRRQGAIEERIDAAGDAGLADPRAVLEELEAACERLEAEGADEAERVRAGAEAAGRHGFHDVYTLTKALAERLIERQRGGSPVAVVRPAIVESALAEPMPGWIETVRVIDPLLVAYGRGRLRVLPGAAEARLDVVPVDLVVNAVLAACAALGGESGEGGAEPSVYQVTSSRNPLAVGEAMAYAREGFARTPLRDGEGRAVRVGRARFVEPGRLRRRLQRRRRFAEAMARRLESARLGRWAGRWVGRWAGRWVGRRVGRWVGRLRGGLRTLDHFLRLLAVYGPYLDHRARYDDGALRALWARLPAADRAAFPVDAAGLDWRRYWVEVHLPGLVRYALRAETGAPPTGAADGRRRAPRAAASGARHSAAAAADLFGLLERAAAASPEAIALQSCRDGRWLRYTYAEAVAAAAACARSLRGHGVGPGDRVALWAAGSPEWVLAAFATHRLGAAIVPLDPQWPAEEVEAALRFTGVRLLCAAPGLGPRLASPPCPVVELGAPLVPEPWVAVPAAAAPEAIATRAEVAPDDLAAILFTSGTTAGEARPGESRTEVSQAGASQAGASQPDREAPAPKAVPLTHANYLANVRDLVPLMALSRDRLLSVLPIHHAFEYTVGLLVPLAGGCTIGYVAKVEPAEISWMMGVTRPTVLVAVPRLLELLHGGIERAIAAGGAPLRTLFRVLHAASAATGGRWGHRLFAKVHRRFGGDLRRIVTGGSALDPELGESFRRMGFRVAEGYGMTETSPVLTVNPWDAIRFGSVGRPLPGVEVALRPVEGEPAGSGEIVVRGANVMRGYYRNREASRAVLEDGWFATGDLGRVDDDGYLRISGRLKEVIVTDAGKNVYPEEVESRYRDLPGVEELVVLGLPGAGGGERVGAVVVPAAGADAAAVEAIRAAIDERSERLPSYQRIARAEIVAGELPKTTTLKVKRAALRERLLRGEIEGRAAPRPPRPAPARREAREQALVELIAGLTRTRPERLLPGDRLDELGLDSLSRAELLGELEARFGVRVDDDAAASLRRVGDLVALLPARPEGRAAGPAPQERRARGRSTSSS